MTAIICGIASTQLKKEEIKVLSHPLVCGVILFKRNFQDYSQLKILVNEIKSRFGHNFIISVDQEGGRVRRFDLPFSRLPPLSDLSKAYQLKKDLGKAMAHTHAWLMSSELLSINIDMSFAPVLDIDNGSNVIGDRAFSKNVGEVIELADFYCRAMHDAGMKTTAKHFPGHGTVVADSHIDLPIDDRSFSEIEQLDLQPFIKLIKANQIDAIMMSHVIYPQACSQAAGYSKYWCQDILRNKYGFKGIIISDDLGMKAADCVGNVHARYDACVASGCDIALACTMDLSIELLNKLSKNTHLRRFPQLIGKSTLPKGQPFWQNRHWQSIRKSMVKIQTELFKAENQEDKNNE
ncbi:MAG: beta-N-acetylhexosaminidase [Proteobacteria bacterium]|nr:beta-N-acetylhexosaminidase [Pseudomonadota bacterium]